MNPPDSCLSVRAAAADRGTAPPCSDWPVPPPGKRCPSVGFPGRFFLSPDRKSMQPELDPRPMQQHRSLASRGMSGDRPASPSFFTERTLAAYLAVSDRTVRNWIRRGDLPSYKLGASRRIDPADVEDFLARHRDEAA
jgi:excisionase family DNA binding protein